MNLFYLINFKNVKFIQLLKQYKIKKFTIKK